MAVALLWLRRDLRLEDNPALVAAARHGAVVPVFVWAPREERAPGAASRVWLHLSLQRLAGALDGRGLRLVLRRGDTLEVLQALARETGAGAVFWNRLHDPDLVARDGAVEDALRRDGLHVESFNAALIDEPHTVRNRQDRPFRVFTPYYRHCRGRGPPRAPHPVPARIDGPQRWPRGDTLASLALLPATRWDRGIRAAWRPGADGARGELDSFADAAVEHYEHDRDRPAVDGVSRLSPHLHFGEISPHQVWHLLARRWPGRGEGALSVKVEPFARQLYWREFAHHLLHHFPHTVREPMAEKFKRFPWLEDPGALAAWQRGRTGYPLVDAGMRELWTTGWMHNRVRMNAASFLVKHLLTHWREGERWFWDTLVDADLANNTMGWQWVAGCGADAAPYFRIFNPVRQGERFDPRGDYVRRWIPELALLPERHIHAPWDAPEAVLRDAKIALGETYPRPLVEHASARARALAAFDRIRAG